MDRRAVPPIPTEPSAVDLERTAELPVLDVAAHQTAQPELGSTDTWVAPEPARLRAPTAGGSASLEQRAEALSRELADTQLALSAARGQVEELTQRLTAREAESRAVRERDRHLEAGLAARDRALERAEQQLGEVRRQMAGQLEALHRREGRRGVFETMLRDLDSEVGRHESLTAQLRRDLAAQQSRIEALEAEMAGARAEHAQALAAAQAAHAQAADAQAADALRADLRVTRERLEAAEADVRAAEDAIHGLESELRARNARIEELTKLNDDWRSTLEAARQSLEERDALIRRLEAETAHSTGLLDPIEHNVRFLETPAAGEAPPDAATRLLVRTGDDGEVVHVLGRKTSIGRTPDNDVQIDTKFVSRHHAVILAGPTQAVIEDLNSTNGVLVNGRRITRRSLKDGDAITVGKTQFRFAVRQRPV